VCIKVSADKFGDWAGAAVAPEAAVLEAFGKIEGISSIETQNYTLEEL
jgi:hypothetical protein